MGPFFLEHQPMIDRTFLMGLERMLEGALEDPHALMVAADWCEDKGEPEVAAGCRWALATGRRPRPSWPGQQLPDCAWWLRADWQGREDMIPLAYDLVYEQVSPTSKVFSSAARAYLFLAVAWKWVGEQVILGEYFSETSK